MDQESVMLVPEVGDLDELAEPVGGRKILRIILEFEVGGSKNHSGRLKEAYLAAVSSAGEAVRNVMLNGSVSHVTSRMTYDYRHMEGAEVKWELVTDHSEL